MTPPSSPPSERRYWLVLLSSITALGIFLFGKTISLSYAYDDMDFLNLAANVLAGRSSLTRTLFIPQNGHFVPVMRLLVFFSTKLFEIHAMPLRVLVFASHLASAVFIGIAARRLLDRTAGLAAAIAYVLPCGFSSMWLWIPTGGMVPLGLVGVTGGLAALASRDRIGATRARALAFAGIVWTVACDSTLAPLALTIVSFEVFDDLRSRRKTSRLLFAGLALGGIAMLALPWAYRRATGAAISINLTRGLPRGAFLLLVAPFRYFFPGLPLPHLIGAPEPFPWGAAAFGAICAAAVGLLAAVLARGDSRRLACAALAAASGPVAEIFLVGLGRWQLTYDGLYDSDRYLFTLLVPISLFAGAVTHDFVQFCWSSPRTRRIIPLTLALSFICIEAGIHRAAMLRRIPVDVFEAHARKFRDVANLARGLSDAANSNPDPRATLAFPDGAIFDRAVHNDMISSRMLLFVLNPHRATRFVLGGSRVGAADEERLNPVLLAWSRSEAGRGHRLSIRNGRLVDDAELSDADFRSRDDGRAVFSGLGPREEPFRWMGRRGEVRLRMISPALEVSIGTDLPLVNVGVSLIAEGSAPLGVAALGTIRVQGAEPRIIRLPVPSGFWQAFEDSPVRVTLEADRARAPEPGEKVGRDMNEVSIRMIRIRFVDG